LKSKVTHAVEKGKEYVTQEAGHIESDITQAVNKGETTVTHEVHNLVQNTSTAVEQPKIESESKTTFNVEGADATNTKGKEPPSILSI